MLSCIVVVLSFSISCGRLFVLCVNITSVNLWLSFVTLRIERPFVQKRGPQSLALAS